jgi:uncharacterized membrane protein YbhN (UPF0104 family)
MVNKTVITFRIYPRPLGLSAVQRHSANLGKLAVAFSHFAPGGVLLAEAAVHRWQRIRAAGAGVVARLRCGQRLD